MKTVALISLGCSRNLVDSEVMLGSLRRAGYRVIRTDVIRRAAVCIINTCAFIGPAREEAVDTILRAAALRKDGSVGRLVVAGCLPQLCKAKLAREFPEVDLFVGTADFYRIAALLGHPAGKGRCHISPGPDYLYDEKTPRLTLTPPHYAYIKIAEGCSNFCSYCQISRIRGAFRSRSIDSVVREVRRLARSGRLKEIDLVAQDTTIFGLDRYGRMVLPELLRRLARERTSVEWIRLLYTHPAHYTDELIETIRDERRVCRYLDIPVQHASDRILRRMNRRTTRAEIEALLAKIRRRIPGVALRTSLIVGFPGETERDFNELLAFVRAMRFERLGAFPYSREAGTVAARLPGQIPEKVKAARLGALMECQQRLTLAANRRLIGKKVRVLIDEAKDGVSTGRTEADAPEVDGAVTVTGRRARVGAFCTVRITDAMAYDLVGKTA